MYEQNKLNRPLRRASLGRSVVLGAGIGLAVVSFFLLMAGEPNPDWPKFWMIRPLIVIPLAGAGAGLVYYFIDPLHYSENRKKILALITCIVIYIVSLWMGTVLGLAGTMWH
jgi:hypothetical protein